MTEEIFKEIKAEKFSELRHQPTDFRSLRNPKLNLKKERKKPMYIIVTLQKTKHIEKL